MQRSDVSVAPDIVQPVSTSHMMEAVTVKKERKKRSRAAQHTTTTDERSPHSLTHTQNVQWCTSSAATTGSQAQSFG